MEAVTCGFCGAKVRGDRPKCLRCGKPLVAKASGKAGGPSTKLIAAAAAFVVIALAGAVALRPSPAAPVSIAPLVAPAPVSAPAAPAGGPAEPVMVNSVDATRPGLNAYTKGDIGTALEKFQRAVELNPKDADALNNLGQALVRLKRAAEAIPYFDRAIEAEPGVWAYQFNRAKALGDLGRWPDAIAGYRQASRTFPDDYITAFNLAKALQRNGDLDEAVAAFEQAIKLAPGQPDFHLSHGLALEAAKRPQDAVAAYKRYLELADPSSEADKVKGRIGLLEGKSPGAATAAATVVTPPKS